jgi:hypothetical protein
MMHTLYILLYSTTLIILWIMLQVCIVMIDLLATKYFDVDQRVLSIDGYYFYQLNNQLNFI